MKTSIHALLITVLLTASTAIAKDPPVPTGYELQTRFVGKRVEQSGQDNVTIDSNAGEIVLRKGQSASFFTVVQFANQIQWYSWNDGEQRRRNKEVTPDNPPAPQLGSWFNKVEVTRATNGRDITFKFYLQAIVPKTRF